jgi:hypothetical protein
MAFNPTTVNGMAVTGLTSPTYTFTLDLNSGSEKSWIITALGGTQTGVSIHSNSNPFSMKVQRAKFVKGAPIIGPNGSLKGGGYNIFKVSIIKGALPLAGQAPQVAIGDFNLRIPAGSDSADAVSLAAMLSCACGFFAGQSNQIYDMIRTNSL